MDRPEKLTRQALAGAVKVLARRDHDLAGVVRRHGPPPLWARRPGFSTLLHIILEQQVSLASARAAYRKLAAAAQPLTPATFLALDDATLKAVGFSRQKAAYGRGLALALASGDLNLRALNRASDDAVRAALTGVKGIGPWSAEIYLLMVLRRPDAWPTGDLALALAAQRVKRLPAMPSAPELVALAELWRPWRAVAARLLWHDYLSNPIQRGAAP
ncbi:MAG: DNA-3-methyladenine glycosylase 2 family protein [Anaerolineales bacterium]|nr:DNA-3-methyladenine glycosylase 2 family protein [Anaerolineales bacterium]